MREYFTIASPGSADTYEFVVGKDRKCVQYKSYNGEYDEKLIRFVGERVDCKTLNVTKVIYCD